MIIAAHLKEGITQKTTESNMILTTTTTTSSAASYRQPPSDQGCEQCGLGHTAPFEALAASLCKTNSISATHNGSQPRRFSYQRVCRHGFQVQAASSCCSQEGRLSRVAGHGMSPSTALTGTLYVASTTSTARPATPAQARWPTTTVAQQMFPPWNPTARRSTNGLPDQPHQALFTASTAASSSDRLKCRSIGQASALSTETALQPPKPASTGNTALVAC